MVQDLVDDAGLARIVPPQFLQINQLSAWTFLFVTLVFPP